MSKLKQPTLLLTFLLTGLIAFAQNDDAASENLVPARKIYVVVAVVVTILVALIVYVARLDSKIAKLEKKERP